MNKMLYVIRGVPGAGKSTFAETLASALGCTHWEADDYHMNNGVYDWKAENIHASHRWCQEGVKECMQLGHTNVIVSNTSTTEKEMKPYLALAEEFGYNVTSLIVENRHGNKSVHDVPDEKVQQMRNRFSIKL